MDRPLSVFISSASNEFAAERKLLKAALEHWPFVRAWAFEEETAYSALGGSWTAFCAARQKLGAHHHDVKDG